MPGRSRKARLRIVGDEVVAIGADDAEPRRRPGPDRPDDPDGAIERRAQQLFEAAAIAWSPLAFASLALLLLRQVATEIGGVDASPASTIWLVFVIVVESSFVVVFFRFGRQDPSRTARANAIVACGVLCLVAAFSYPWAVSSDHPVARQTAACLAAATVLGATALFGARPHLVWMPLCVPIGWAVLDAGSTTLDARHVPALIGPALSIAILSYAVARVVARAHRRIVDDMLAAEARQRELAAAREIAEQADRDKSRFLAMASHDLRQPLHALGLFAASLEQRLRGTSHEPIVSDMVQSIDWLGSSFNALMDVSQLDAGSVRPKSQRFPLRDTFRRLHMHFAGQAEMAGLAFRFSAGGKSVTSDPQLIERIVGNLIQNALKYTVRGGVVVVARTTPAHFNIEVWDTGLGITDLEMPRIFHEYYQIDRHNGTRARGLGMGLAIVKRLVRLLGHELVVVSCPGRGSMFRLSIPRGSLSGIEDATAAADTLPMTLSGQRTALIVDDDAAIRQGLALLLTEWGYRSVCASDHDEACYAVRVSESVPDLILCDLHLGDGPDGIAVIQAVRRQCARDLPAILITGDPSSHEIDRAVGSDLLILAKPVQPKILRNALRSLEEAG